MTEDWKIRYKDKIATSKQAVTRIRPGDRVFIGSACGEPQELVRAIVQGHANLTDTELLHVLTLGVAPYTDPKYSQVFRANAFFIGNSMRDAVNHARADYTPIFLSQVPGLFKSRRVDIDVALIMVSPPDEHGYVSLGVSVDITKAGAESARMVIAQVNRHMPRTLGDCFMHVDQLNLLVPHDEPLLEWPVAAQDSAVQRIAEHISHLVQDGATLQMGIGRIPDAVLAHLTERNDLGIHTEMFSDGIVDLVRKGVITGKHKTLHRGKIVGSFAAGSRALFEFINDNPEFEMHPSDYTNDPRTISRHDNMIAINAALEVDLTGQVCSDSVGQQFYSGIGGHADFIRGSALAKNGKPIIALPSTAVGKDGKVHSRISAQLQDGAGVVTTRGDVHYVVTEFGIAYLHGKTMRQRAMSLINIAHPDFRGDLLHAAKHRHIVYPNQILPSPTEPPGPEFFTTMKLRNGNELHFRPIRADDESMIKDMFYSFSEQTVYLRFHHTLKSMPHNRLQVFCNVDHKTEVAIVGVAGSEADERIIAVGRYFTAEGSQQAELAFVVHDDWQRCGIGTFLFRHLIAIARSQGIRRYSADVLIENAGMLKIFHRSGMPIVTNTESGVVHVDMTDEPKAAVKAE